MKNAIQQWTSIKKRIKGKTILLFLDFDGTLAPIASTPSRSHLPSNTKKLLKQLHSLTNVKLAIISGRDLDEIRKMVGISGIVYGGNHGCQISGPDINWHHAFPVAWLKELQQLYKELRAAAKKLPGVIVEYKNISIGVHFRNVKNKAMARFREVLAEVSKPYIASLLIKPSIGKKVVELGLVTAWNKGKAVNWLIKRLKNSQTSQSYVPIYIGDDVTDETVFTALKHKGITIHVGAGQRTAASCYLRNPSEVAMFLEKLSLLR